VISAREFCREPLFPVALFLTYSFDPLFFERIPLTDLDKGGSRRILVVADGSHVREAMQHCLGQLVHLGRRYVLAETVLPNTFHPKLIVRLSSKGGRIWLGSGNLTYGGWGGNSEVASAWSVGPNEPDRGAWLRQLLDSAAAATRSASFSAELEKAYDLARWLGDIPEESTATPLLFATPDRPLGPQLAERWRGRRFEEVRLCTGSTDSDGAFLSWAHRTFGVKRAIICLNPAFASFESNRLAKLPVEVRIIKSKDDSRMHAKFYWFAGGDGDAALMGSANCSAAAWIAGHGFGNFEAVVPYDAPSEADFRGILSVFEGERLPPEDALITSAFEAPEIERESAKAYRLVSVRLRATGRIIEAVLDPAPLEGSGVELSIQGGRQAVEINVTRQKDLFVGRLPTDFEMGQATAFASARIRLEGDLWLTDARWIDSEAALARTTAEGLSEPGLKDLSRRAVMNADQQQILEAIHSVSAKLLRGESPDAGETRTGSRAADKPDARPDKQVDVEAIDPAATLRSLTELASRRDAKFGNVFATHGGSLAGVMAMLFSREAEEAGEDVDLSKEAWTGDNPEPASDEPGDIKGNLEDHHENVEKPTAESPTETRARFYEQLDGFLIELGTAAFADKCAVTTMVQALAFPLLVCVRGNERGWLPQRALASIGTRVVAVMFDRSYGKEKPIGLFRNVKERYRALGLSEEFLRAVGGGTLWSALLAALAGSSDQAPRSFILQANALALVFNCKELLAFATPDSLDGLSRASIIPTAEQAARGKIAAITGSLASLTTLLKEREETIYAAQGNGKRLVGGGALLWSSRWGWRVLPAIPAQAYSSGYINLDLASGDDPRISKAIAAVSDAIRQPVRLGQTPTTFWATGAPYDTA